MISTILGTMVIGRLIDWWVKPESYKVYLVGDFDNDDVRKIWKGFDQQGALELDGITIRLQKVDGKGTNTTVAERISSELADKKGTLMVVGHLYSTPTKAALPNYLHADPPIPVILPFETNPDLLPPKIPEDTYYPVFRLSPTDERQAAMAADFAVKHGAKAIWVVEDALNSVYSRDLAREFIKQVHERRSSRVLLWTRNEEIPSADAVKALGIDWVFFAGHWSNGLILTRQVKEIWKGQPRPSILLSDWCVDPALIEQGGADMDGAYFTHPMRADDFNRIGYTFWGDHAYRLLRQLIQDTDSRFGELASRKGELGYYLRWVAGFHNVADARNALHAFMEESVNLNRTFDLDGYRYTFTRDGTPVEPSFHVWQVQKVDGEVKFMDIPN